MRLVCGMALPITYAKACSTLCCCSNKHRCWWVLTHRRYFRRLQKRYAPQSLSRGIDDAVAGGPQDSGNSGGSGSSSAEASDPSLQYPITCVNLLRCSMQKRNELTLSEHFAEVRCEMTPCVPRLLVWTHPLPPKCVHINPCAAHHQLQLGTSADAAPLPLLPKSIRLIRKQEAAMPIQIRNFDWHASLKDFREAGTVEVPASVFPGD